MLGGGGGWVFVQWHSLLNIKVCKNASEKEKGAMLGSFLFGHFAAMFLAGERGTPFLSVSRSVWIPRVWARFLVSTNSKQNYIVAGLQSVTSCQ